MPTSLLLQLKKLAQENHYLDVSEEIRSVLRSKWLEQRSPYKAKVQEMKSQLSGVTDKTQISALKKTLKLLEDINEL